MGLRSAPTHPTQDKNYCRVQEIGRDKKIMTADLFLKKRGIDMKVMLLLLYLKINGNALPDDLQNVWKSQELAPKWRILKISLTDMVQGNWQFQKKSESTD